MKILFVLQTSMPSSFPILKAVTTRNRSFFICTGALPSIVKSAALSPMPALQEAVSRAISTLTMGSESSAVAAAACGAVQAIAAGEALQASELQLCDFFGSAGRPQPDPRLSVMRVRGLEQV
jgi:hypothetical protein